MTGRGFSMPDDLTPAIGSETALAVDATPATEPVPTGGNPFPSLEDAIASHLGIDADLSDTLNSADADATETDAATEDGEPASAEALKPSDESPESLSRRAQAQQARDAEADALAKAVAEAEERVRREIEAKQQHEAELASLRAKEEESQQAIMRMLGDDTEFQRLALLRPSQRSAQDEMRFEEMLEAREKYGAFMDHAQRAALVQFGTQVFQAIPDSPGVTTEAVKDALTSADSLKAVSRLFYKAGSDAAEAKSRDRITQLEQQIKALSTRALARPAIERGGRSGVHAPTGDRASFDPTRSVDDQLREGLAAAFSGR